MERPLAEALPALAEAARTVGATADPEPRDDRRQPRHGLACRRRAAAAARVRRRGEGRERSRRAVVPLPEFVVGPKRNVLAEDELILGVSVDATREPADVHEGRPAQRDGDRGRLARGARRRRAACGPRSARLGPVPTLVRRGLADADCVSAARRRGREPDRRRPRHGVVQAARAAHPDEARARPVPRMRIELNVNGEQREADVWEGESLLYRVARAARPARLEERVRAGRVRLVLGAARRRSSSARASCSPLRPTGTRSSRSKGWPTDGRLHRSAGGVRRRRRGAVRLLHAGTRRRDRRPARAQRRTRATTTSARRSPATSAAAPGTRRSSTPCEWRRRR